MLREDMEFMGPVRKSDVIETQKKLIDWAEVKSLRAQKGGGLKCAAEVFADRSYEEDGSLVARTKPGAVIADENEVIERVGRDFSPKKQPPYR